MATKTIQDKKGGKLEFQRLLRTGAAVTAMAVTAIMTGYNRSSAETTQPAMQQSENAAQTEYNTLKVVKPGEVYELTFRLEEPAGQIQRDNPRPVVNPAVGTVIGKIKTYPAKIALKDGKLHEAIGYMYNLQRIGYPRVFSGWQTVQLEKQEKKVCDACENYIREVVKTHNGDQIGGLVLASSGM